MMRNHQLINQASGQQEWYTPAEIIEAARATMGGIDLDPASCPAANKIVKAAHILTQDDDGLQRQWWGRVWLNHPYGRQENQQWPAKLLAEYQAGRVQQACCITRADVSAHWFYDTLLIFPTCFPRGRVNYIEQDAAGALVQQRGVPWGSCITYLGRHVDNFVKHFGPLGIVKVAI